MLHLLPVALVLCACLSTTALATDSAKIVLVVATPGVSISGQGMSLSNGYYGLFSPVAGLSGPIVDVNITQVRG